MTSIQAITNKPQNTQTTDIRLQEAAQAFEAIFLRNMIKSMRSSSLGEDLLGSSGGSQFRDMMDSQLADDMATNKSGLGIAEMLSAEWKKTL